MDLMSKPHSQLRGLCIAKQTTWHLGGGGGRDGGEGAASPDLQKESFRIA